MATVRGLAEAQNRLRALPRRASQIAEAVLLEWAPRCEAWMQANHKWQNQTGLAERSLRATVAQTDSGTRMVLRVAHGVTYGIYLETMQQGRFAILRPAIRVFWPSISADLRRRLLAELGGERRAVA